MDEELKTKLRAGARKAVQVCADVSEVAIHLRQPSVLGLSSVAAKLVNSIAVVRSKTAYDKLDGWCRLQGTGSFSDYLCKLCKSQQESKQDDEGKTPKDTKSNGMLMLVDVHDLRFAWVEYDTWVEGPWIPNAQDPEASLAMLGRYVWETLGKQVVVVKQPLGPDLLAPDSASRSYESQTAHRIFDDYVLPFRQKGMGISLLFYGEPGTGKSEIMRKVADLSGALSLRMSAKDIEYMRNAGAAISLLRPSAVLIDDLERVERPEAMLTQISQLHDQAALLMASVNQIDELDAALLRAGRFDELVLVHKLDDAVLDGLIGDDTPDKARQRLRALPVAYIDYFRKLCKARGMDAAVAAIGSLEMRAAKVRALGKKAKDDSKDSPPAVPVA